ncbi:unnamed protein product [Linum tenue]|uniref:Uncharacterized protein n=1 Tax=Linum tenue TaxID=586396 RepID=A0AAV0IDH6_9ROSI|nr:unnamed protein product [Linum tenue]
MGDPTRRPKAPTPPPPPKQTTFSLTQKALTSSSLPTIVTTPASKPRIGPLLPIRSPGPIRAVLLQSAQAIVAEKAGEEKQE